MGITAKVETVTPAKASKWLEAMAANRILRESVVFRHAEVMERGEWELNGEAVKFDTHGILLDGQHRLKAIELSGVSVPMLVVRGLESSAITTLDTGIKRTLADTLRMRGEPNHFALAATLVTVQQTRTAIHLKKWPHGNQMGTPTIDWSLQLLAAEPGIREATRESNNMRPRHTGISLYPKVVSAGLHLFGEIDAEDAETFFKSVATGVELEETDIIYKLRKRFQSGNPDIPKTVRDQMALVIKAWNHWRNGTTVANLRVRFGGSKPEEFPEPK